MKFRLLIEMLEKFERKFYKIAQPVLQEPFPEFNDNIIKQLDRYKLTPEHGGETAQNLLKIHGLIEHYPNLCLIIHVNPIFCCPGLVSESIFKVLEKEIDIPIVSLTYDGTGTRKNEILAPYLHFIRQGEWDIPT
jgi:hypothetical protein